MNCTRYVCTGCGNCCEWPGDVRVTHRELRRLAAYLGLSERAFVDRYTRLGQYRTGLSLCEAPDRGDACVFFTEERRCAIYPVRPQQCRDFPNYWNFPGFLERCEVVPIHFQFERLGGDRRDLVPAGYRFPERPLGERRVADPQWRSRLTALQEVLS